MSDDTKLYISVESPVGHLVIDGPMTLWRELVDSLGRVPTERRPDQTAGVVVDRQLTEAAS